MKTPNTQDVLKSLLAARSINETRYFMTECYLDKSDGTAVLIGLDGMRMVYYKPESRTATALGLDELPTGYVDIDLKRLVVTACRNPVVKDAQFPNWSRVVPDSTAEALSEYTFKTPNKVFKIDYSALVWAVKTGITFNPEYLRTVALFDPHRVYTSIENPKTKAFRINATFNGGEYNVLIMPTNAGD